MSRPCPLNHLLRISTESLLLHGHLPQSLQTIAQFSLYIPLPRSRSCESPSSAPCYFTPHDAISLSNLPRQCMACSLPIHGAFARAFGTAYHIQCFKCIVSTISILVGHCVILLKDCGDVVTSKFFTVDGPDGRKQLLCERDYFRRIDHLCAKCGMALRGCYIMACGRSHTFLPMIRIPLPSYRQEISC